MSSLCKRMAKPKKVCARKRRQAMHERCTKKYTSFNVFTDYGENRVIWKCGDHALNNNIRTSTGNPSSCD